MSTLVKLYNGKEGRVGTFDIFKSFGYNKHDFLKAVIFKNRALFEEKGPIIVTSVNVTIKKKRGRPDESILLNERQFILLVLLAKNTPEAINLKNRIEIEFFKMRDALAKAALLRLSEEWKEARNGGKDIYLQKTDNIKMFIDYAFSQGSTNAKQYYKNLANMENKALFLIEQKYPNIREMLNIKQLMQIATADQIIEIALAEGMKKGLHYKDIYSLAKDKIIQFSDIIGKSVVIDMIESKQIGSR